MVSLSYRRRVEETSSSSFTPDNDTAGKRSAANQQQQPRPERSRTRFIRAIRQNEVQVVRQLVEHYPDLLVEVDVRHGRTPLHVACRRFKAQGLPAVASKTRFRSSGLARRLLEQQQPSAAVAVATADDDQDPGPSIEILKLLIDKCPVALRMVDNIMCTPLHYAAAYGVPCAIVDQMITGFPHALRMVNDEGGRIPLHAACLHCQDVDVIELLVHRCCQTIRTLTKGGATPLHCALNSPTPTTPQAAAARNTMIRKLLNRYPQALGITTRKQGATPLHFAVRAGVSLDLLQTMIRMCPQALTMQDRWQGTPLHRACSLATTTSPTAFTPAAGAPAAAAADAVQDLAGALATNGAAPEATRVTDFVAQRLEQQKKCTTIRLLVQQHKDGEAAVGMVDLFGQTPLDMILASSSQQVAYDEMTLVCVVQAACRAAPSALRRMDSEEQHSILHRACCLPQEMFSLRALKAIVEAWPVACLLLVGQELPHDICLERYRRLVQARRSFRQRRSGEDTDASYSDDDYSESESSNDDEPPPLWAANFCPAMVDFMIHYTRTAACILVEVATTPMSGMPQSVRKHIMSTVQEALPHLEQSPNPLLRCTGIMSYLQALQSQLQLDHIHKLVEHDQVQALLRDVGYQNLICDLMTMDKAGRSYIHFDPSNQKQGVRVLQPVSHNPDCVLLHLRENPCLFSSGRVEI